MKHKIISKKQKLQKQFAEARNQLDAIERKEAFKHNKQYVGRFFKYRNNYGSGCPGWWLYVAVVGIDRNAQLIALQFQRTSKGIFELRPRRDFFHISEGYKEITQEEFFEACMAFCKAFYGSLNLSELGSKLGPVEY